MRAHSTPACPEPDRCLKMNKAIALRAADATDKLRADDRPSGSASTTATTRCSRGGWACRTRQVTTACQDYATFLREKVAAADRAGRADAGERCRRCSPRPPPKFSSVPDLNEIIALPAGRDARRRRALQRPARGAGGRGGAADDGAAPAAARRRRTRNALLHGWLAALKTLDFDALSRNAQVDYLYIKRTRGDATSRAPA